MGAELEIPASSARLDRLLFAEGGARILVSVPADQDAAWQQALALAAVPAERLGAVTAAASLAIRQAGQPLLEQSLAALEACYEQAIPRRMGEGARAE
jgi:phosphoribosylformylglycinamidine synthase